MMHTFVTDLTTPTSCFEGALVTRTSIRYHISSMLTPRKIQNRILSRLPHLQSPSWQGTIKNAFSILLPSKISPHCSPSVHNLVFSSAAAAIVTVINISIKSLQWTRQKWGQTPRCWNVNLYEWLNTLKTSSHWMNYWVTKNCSTSFACGACQTSYTHWRLHAKWVRKQWGARSTWHWRQRWGLLTIIRLEDVKFYNCWFICQWWMHRTSCLILPHY